MARSVVVDVDADVAGRLMLMMIAQLALSRSAAGLKIERKRKREPGWQLDRNLQPTANRCRPLVVVAVVVVAVSVTVVVVFPNSCRLGQLPEASRQLGRPSWHEHLIEFA